MSKIASLWPPHVLGKPAGRSRGGGGRPSGVVTNVCVGANHECGAPWFWVNKNVDKNLQYVRTDLVDPCVGGSVAGYGLKVTESAAAMSLAEGATLTAGQRAAAIFGPEGWAVGALGGCFFGIGLRAQHGIKALVHKLNPFDRTGGHSEHFSTQRP